MSDTGILYTEYATLSAPQPIASLWSYETRTREAARPSVRVNASGDREFWLERWDPLLNSILPSTHVSIVVNAGDSWAAGRSLVRSSVIPRACVVGGMTESRILRLGSSVEAVGIVIPPYLTSDVLGIEPAMLVDQIVPLSDLWAQDIVDQIMEPTVHLGYREALTRLRDAVMVRIRSRDSSLSPGYVASQFVQSRRGRVSIDALATLCGVSRRRFGREFHASTGMNAKLFARITRFQSLVTSLLSTDVSRWASLATIEGFYDQAHMINEFSSFAGSSPRAFFQPRATDLGGRIIAMRGRPSEWLRERDG